MHRGQGRPAGHLVPEEGCRGDSTVTLTHRQFAGNRPVGVASHCYLSGGRESMAGEGLVRLPGGTDSQVLAPSKAAVVRGVRTEVCMSRMIVRRVTPEAGNRAGRSVRCGTVPGSQVAVPRRLWRVTALLTPTLSFFVSRRLQRATHRTVTHQSGLSLWTDRGSIPGPPECKSGVIPLHHPPLRRPLRRLRLFYIGRKALACFPQTHDSFLISQTGQQHSSKQSTDNCSSR